MHPYCPSIVRQIIRLSVVFSNIFFFPLEGNADSCRALLDQYMKRGTLMDSPHCPATDTFLNWVYLIKNEASFSEISRFLLQHPDWPRKSFLIEKAEEALSESIPDEDIIAWFEANPPQTAWGALFYAKSLLDIGREEDAQAVVQDIWLKGQFSEKNQRIFREKVGHFITQADDENRLSYLLWHNRLDEAQRLLPHVSQEMQKIAAVWMAYLKGDHEAERKYESLSPDLRRHEGLRYMVAQKLKKEKRFSEAAHVLFAAASTHPYLWWKERNFLAREALYEKNPQLAYDLIKEHRLEEGSSLADAEWFAGWIALRFLSSPDIALSHFEKLYAAVKSPISVARAAYWAGRAQEELQDMDAAQEWYKKGIAFRTTFYGQLCAYKLGVPLTPKLETSPKISQADRQAFNNKELVKVIKLLGTSQEYVREFLSYLAKNATSRAESLLVLELASQIQGTAGAAVAKAATKGESLTVTSAYPRLTVPKADVEKSLIHAIIYQESRFDTGAVSPAGAEGLMQLMPATAKREAKTLGVAYHPKKVFDASYNILLGTQHIRRDLNIFNGSYILAICAYNAGPEAVQRWIQQNGHPRNIDVIDWIELIPYGETRNYVQRVLENIPIYRQLFKENSSKTLVHDLLR